MAIHYTKDENAYLRREVASFRKKLKRLQRKGVSQGLLPTNIKVTDLKRTYDTWEDLEDRLRRMREFSSVGVTRKTKKGLVGTDILIKYKQQEIESSVELAKKRRESLRMTKGRSAIKTQSLRNLTRKIQKMQVDIENIDFKTLQKVNANALTLEEYSVKNESFYESFFKMIFQSGEYSGANEKIINDLQKSLSQFTPEELSELLDKEDTISDLMDKYEVAKHNNWIADKDTEADFRVALNNLRNQMPRLLKEYGKG